MGSNAASEEKIQPAVMMIHACLRRSLRSSRRACVMVCQRSTVIAVNVNTDSSLANTCKWSTYSSFKKWYSPVCHYTLSSLCRHTHREEARHIAAKSCLPVNGVVVVPTMSEHVDRCYDYQVDAHAEVSEGQMAHEETRNGQLRAAACPQWWKKKNKKTPVSQIQLNRN